MAKRSATAELNHDNWDREDDPEEAGTFSKASEDVLKKRVIKVAKRRNPISSQNSEEKPNAFGTFGGFTKTPSTSASNAFGFLTNLPTNPNKSELSKTNGISEKKSEEKTENNLDEYYAKLKGLNESVTEWIQKHVSENPLINLQPIFRDYDKYFAELEKNKNKTETEKLENNKSSFNFTPVTTSNTVIVPTFSFGASAPKFNFGVPTTGGSGFSFTSSVPSTVTVSQTSSESLINSPLASKPPFTFGNSTSGIASSGKFSFTSTVIKSAEEANVKTNTNDEEENEDEPPRVEFKPVVEEGHIYSIRCKVFVKKENSYGDRGVGNLYLKPVPDSKKVQLIVRADTNLGNLLCNFILSEGIPMKRMGKKDVMLVCLPTPDTKPPPVPILLRVKTSEDADELLNILEKHKK